MAMTNDSLTRHVEPIEASAYVAAAAFIADMPTLALGEGEILHGAPGAFERHRAHSDALLVAATDGQHLVTGGDDGRVTMFTGAGGLTEIGSENGRWIDAIALGPSGACAWSAGKTVTARDAKGKVRQLSLPSTSRGLCFAPKGYRLAVSHIDGASLWFPSTDAAVEKLEWKGVHLDITWSADGRFVVTSMQENQLHGWQLPAKTHMRMSGYPAKTRSVSWSGDGNWLATSGAEAAIIWPFAGTGPTGKAPRECGVRPKRVTRVSFHPKALVLALGYEDGWVMLCRLTDAAELLVRPVTQGGAISALAWDRTGQRLLFGAEDGAAGLLTLPVG